MDVVVKAEKVAALLQQSGSKIVKHENVVKVLSEILNSNVFILDANSNVVFEKIVFENFDFPKQEDLDSVYLTRKEVELDSGFAIISPIVNDGQHLGNIVVTSKEKMLDEDIGTLVICSSIVGKAIVRKSMIREEESNRNMMAAKNALKSLSYTEVCAVKSIFEELNGSEGLLVASKIADRVGFTRSVIVNAVRKLEGANVVESRSLGMKGTHIKIINEHLMNELSNLNLK